MPLSRAQMDAKLDEHFRYEATDDVESVLATLAEDARHDVVGWPAGPVTGRENARAFYQRMFAELAESKVTSIKRLYGPDFLIDESVWSGRAVGKPFGLDGRNRLLSFRILHVLEFADNGQIRHEQVWLDMAAILQQLKD